MPLTEDNKQPSTCPSIVDPIRSAVETAAALAAERTMECIETKARKTADEFKERANHYLRKLLDKKSAVDEDKQRLHALIEEYHAKKSTFSKWAEWHGQLTWYEEMGYVTAFIAVGALVGFAFNLAALFTLLSVAVIYFARSLFMEHYEISLEQNDALIAGVSVLIESLILSIEQLTALAEDVNAIQIELDEQCTLMEHEINAFRARVVEMNLQMETLKNQVLALEQIQEALVQENERMLIAHDRANIEIATASATITAQSRQLADIQNRLDETHQALLERNNELTQVQTQIASNLIALSETREKYERELTFFTSQRAEMNREGRMDMGSNENQMSKNDIEQQLLESDALISRAQEMYIH